MSADWERRLNRRKFLTAAAGVVSLPTVLAACGDSDSGGTSSAAPATSAAAPTTAAPTTSAAGPTTTAAETTSSAAPATTAASEPTSAPTPIGGGGGRLRVGLVGGGTDETLDPYAPNGEVSYARNHNHYELLLDFGPDGAPYEVLAEELSPNAAGDVWKIKLKDGIEFHDGKPFVAADVVYSLQHVLDKKLALEGANDLYFLQPKNIRALDDRTVELTLDQPVGNLRDNLASRALSIMSEGLTDFSKPNGTGPFKLESFTPGQRSLSVRFENYRESVTLDELEIISIDDTAARVNALTTGQIDAAGSLDYSQIASVESAGFQILEAETGGFQANMMCVEQDPYSDPKVRLALRLLHDREQMIATIYLGHGAVGNDMGMRFDPIYPTDIAQIAYDPERAKSLLAEAGKSDLTVEILTSNAYPGMLESATLFKEQAKAGGVKVNLKQQAADAYYGDAWLAHPFKQTLWGQRSQDLFFLQALESNAPYNETCWKRPDFDKLTREARSTVDPDKRKELYHAAQQMLWDDGGYAIWGYGNYVDGLSSKVSGLTPSAVRWLGWYTFKDASVAA